MTLWIGTSGWQYRHWRGRLYPDDLPAARWFDRYVESFATVELNVTFYGQPRPATFEAWARRVPDDFTFAVKASRFLTHVRRLRDSADSVDRLMEGAGRLGRHLGPILLQLPPDLALDADHLEETLAAFPPRVRVAVEARHASWFADSAYRVLRARGAALCWADRRGILNPEVVTASEWGYIRFHAGRALPRSCYGVQALATWIDRIKAAWPASADVFAFFNNDHAGCAPRDAVVLANLAREAGLRPTRTPDIETTPVG